MRIIHPPFISLIQDRVLPTLRVSFALIATERMERKFQHIEAHMVLAFAQSRYDFWLKNQEKEYSCKIGYIFNAIQAYKIIISLSSGYNSPLTTYLQI